MVRLLTSQWTDIFDQDIALPAPMHTFFKRVFLTTFIFVWSLQSPASDAPNLADPEVHPYADSSKGRENYKLAGEIVNEARLYDFYARQADYYLDQKEVPDLLPAYPGIEAGIHGHWGKHSQNDVDDDAWREMEFGNVLGGTIRHSKVVFPRAVNIDLGEGVSATFDPDRLSYPSVWSGDFVHLPIRRWGIVGYLGKGGEDIFRTNLRADWEEDSAWPKSLSGSRSRYHGYHRHGDDIIFSYSVDQTLVLERPSAISVAGEHAFVREMQFKGHADKRRMKLFQLRGRPMIEIKDHGSLLIAREGKEVTVFHLKTFGDWRRGVLSVDGKLNVVMNMSAIEREASLELTVWTGPDASFEKFLKHAGNSAEAVDLEAFTDGGRAQWNEEIVMKGSVAGDSSEPYVIDTLPVPFENPYQSPMFLGGVDFLSNGDAFVCTFFGDVWKVTGIDQSLENVKWKRYATGLNQALGLAVRDDQVFVLGKDQITRLHDLNNDGEADYYESFCNAFPGALGGHDFNTGLQVSDLGYFYFGTGHMGIVEVSPNGLTARSIATGIRNPDGIGVSPDGIVTCPPQEGQWTPCGLIVEAHEGEFYGFGRQKKEGDVIAPPLVFLPRGIDNSSGGQVWVTSDKWGALQGQMLGLSYGAGSHYSVLRDTDGGRPQGAVVPLKGEFLSGSHRGRFHPRDGQLYVAGTQGWGDYAVKDGSLQRVRYTGKAVRYPVGFKVHSNGIRVDFPQELEKKAMKNVKRAFAQMWNYQYSDGYGSPEYSVREPDKLGHDRLTISSMHVLEDGRSLFVEIPGIQTAMQMHLRLHVRFADGVDFKTELFPSIIRFGEAFAGIEGLQPVASDKEDFITLRIFDPKPVKKEKAGESEKGREIVVKGISGLKYDTTKIQVKPGERLTITMKNTDPAMPHNWVLVTPFAYQRIGDASMKMLSDPKAAAKLYVPDSKDVLAHTSVVNPGQSDSVTFDAPSTPGEYPFMCTYPGHWALMKGILIVQ